MTFPTQGVLDNFNRANETPLSTGWATLDSLTGLNLVSNAVHPPTTTSIETGSFWSGSTFGPNTEIYCTVTTLPSGALSSIGLEGRVTTPGGSRNGYHLDWVTGAGNCGYYKITGNGYAQIGSGFTIALAAGDKLGFVIAGTSTTHLQAYLYHSGAWAAVGSGVDDSTSPYTAAGYIGIQSYQDQASETSVLDDFGGGTVSPGTYLLQTTAGSFTLTGHSAIELWKLP